MVMHILTPNLDLKAWMGAEGRMELSPPDYCSRRMRSAGVWGGERSPTFPQDATRAAVLGINSHHGVSRPHSTARAELLGSQPLRYHPMARKLLGIASACHLL